MRKIIAIIFVVLFASCQRNDAPNDNNDSGNDEAILFFTEKLNEYVLSNEIFQDLVNNCGDALLNAEASFSGKTNNTKTDPAITVVPFDLETFPKTITVDYGSGTLCQDGVTRRGIVTIVSTGWFGELDSVHTIEFTNFYHEIFKVEGTQVVENWGENEDGHVMFGVTVEDGVISNPNSVNLTFNESSTSTWIAGSETPLNIWDDEYLLEGIQWGSSSDGTPYLVDFEPPLHYSLLPREIKSGIVDLEIDGITGFKINFTNQTITVLGETTSWD